MENILQILIITIIQGIAEFVPVSSSAHVNVLSKIFGYKDIELVINVSAHFGSLIAVLLFFKKEIFEFSKNKNLFFKMIISSIPLGVVGLFLIKYQLVTNLRTLEFMGWTTILFGILLYFSDKFQMTFNIKDNFSFKNAIIIGCFQILALIPGVSRSGIIITGSRFLKFSRVEAAKISFLLSIPALSMWSAYGFYDLFKQNNSTLNVSALITVLFSFVFSFLTIKYLLIFLKKFSLNLFVVYRLLFGVLLLFVANL